MERKLTGENIICISSVDWEPIWTRKQQVMSRLPASCKILYVEPPITLLSAVKDRSLWFKWLQWLKGPRKITENIYLYSPPVVLPFGNIYSWVNRLNQRWLLLFVKKIARRLGMDNPLVWTYLPNSLILAEGLNPKILIYDCVDEHSEYTGLIKKDTMLEMERGLLERCDLVFVTAPGLYESKKECAGNIHLLPNAADVEHFARAALPETPVPDEIGALSGPVLGFVGVIHDWIDLNLIAYLAQKRPDWSVAMVGPVGAGISVDRLKALPNVHFFGRKSKEELPGYIKGFDVCLNPFRINDLTRRVSPLKFYEYLASGKPVVSVEMPGVMEFSGVIETASDYEGFNRGVERALAGESEERKKLRLGAAARNSWESRVEFMMDKIREVMKH
ncbi:glycosyltransferase [Desulfocucumis palustris]|uniref:Glycosyltransferase n=1 Tax=Desulfocucumis palustris TaxID=1898651 RepID=A0A2L2XHB1_9FIRM|nr:glycosyltransferase [Desulfocucumis palustris]GBF35374.1 glycosyltransferase [Desulfocucumis palustris]